MPTGTGDAAVQACAACKYQRRKCTKTCLLAPYFPHHHHKQFLKAHKLFGVSNITKMVKDLDQPQKDIAMHTLIFQAEARANDPVGGCYRIIRELQHQIDCTIAELDLVLQQLAIFGAKARERQELYPDFSYFPWQRQEQPFCVVNHQDLLKMLFSNLTGVKLMKGSVKGIV